MASDALTWENMSNIKAQNRFISRFIKERIPKHLWDKMKDTTLATFDWTDDPGEQPSTTISGKLKRDVILYSSAEHRTSPQCSHTAALSQCAVVSELQRLLCVLDALRSSCAAGASSVLHSAMVLPYVPPEAVRCTSARHLFPWCISKSSLSPSTTTCPLGSHCSTVFGSNVETSCIVLRVDGDDLPTTSANQQDSVQAVHEDLQELHICETHSG